MLTIYRTTLFVMSLTVILPLKAATAVTGYLSAEQRQIATLLPPPPSTDTPQNRADLQAVLAIQANRTAEQIAKAKRDDHLEDAAFPFAREIFGPTFTVDRHPLTAALFRRVYQDFEQSLMPAKAFYGRPRPYEADSRVKPLLPPPEGDSYPSGHAMDSYLTALLLAQMVPEKRSALFERAASNAQSRVIAGVHYPSDLEGGKLAATALAARLLANPQLQADLQRARVEVRANLQL
ncbi:acid phosphatase [Serratia marcescens]|uniref:acid phosphatase n=1 Tax=Serratia marcescens TaxID=615 RepID=UPI000EF220F3|nr:phosphatase PAP2 family protein [Serratia marcescens]RLO36392.1 acid phosphatase [Serratia marcescens]RLO40541.1 acid phosphatase [Serratia marcescens]